MTPDADDTTGKLQALLGKLDEATARLAAAPNFAKPTKTGPVLDIARRALMLDGGGAAVEARAQALEEAGIFRGSDWGEPEILVPSLTRNAFKSADADTVLLEALSELRMLAVARGDYPHPQLSAEQAHHYLTQVLALNLRLLFGPPDEAERTAQGRLAELPRRLLVFLAERVGYEHIIDSLIDEIWRILEQRPIQVAPVKEMITQIAVCQANPAIDLGVSGQGADRLVSALYGPTQECREDPGIGVYGERVLRMDQAALQREASDFARSMHDTGLASPYHAVLLAHLREHGEHLLAEALGLSATGRDCLLCYRELVGAMIAEAVNPSVPQAIYGLALTLERGLLYQPAVAAALWRQLQLPLSPPAQARLAQSFGHAVSPRGLLLEGVLCMLGLPLGVGQGNNPTCQSARALSMWAYNDPDYLLQMVAWAARDDEVVIHFEGQPISSRESVSGVARQPILDLDPVSMVLVPHLDPIYAEMGRRCSGREGDPHRWVNREFHGWWVGRGFHINVDVASGRLFELDAFLRHFYACYHPYYNGGQPVIHPQPAGVAVTDSAARFIGWHAISIVRVALDGSGVMRVYFFNPNNDSGQDWGDDITVSTAGNGEVFGEASLPFEQFAARLYIFHYDPLERGVIADVPRSELDVVIGYIHRSWGKERLPELTRDGHP